MVSLPFRPLFKGFVTLVSRIIVAARMRMLDATGGVTAESNETADSAPFKDRFLLWVICPMSSSKYGHCRAL